MKQSKTKNQIQSMEATSNYRVLHTLVAWLTPTSPTCRLWQGLLNATALM